MTGVRGLAGISGLVGPAGALLYETGHMRAFPGDPLSDVWLLAIIASFGAGMGVVCFVKGARIFGLACVLSNLAVLLLYGFIALFFTLGGSR